MHKLQLKELKDDAKVQFYVHRKPNYQDFLIDFDFLQNEQT